MSFFNKSKLKIKSELKGNDSKVYVDYYRLKELDSFKVKLLGRLLENTTCLGIIDTKFQANDDKNANEKIVNDAAILLDQINIDYVKKTIKKEPVITALGVSIKLNNANELKDYIIGFSLSEDKIKDILPITNSYNIHYYIGSNETFAGNLQDKVQMYYENSDELNHNFDYNVFDNNSIKNTVITTSQERIEGIRKMLENLSTSLN